MASRMKEDERNEKIIRGLLKLPANKRCINCNNLGPQYVCTNFWTFICINCSGLHREFCHRVKSISMAKFTTQEVNALQEGGNERAKEIYFKEWDPQRYAFPDSSNIDKLRDFIKQVYINRRFTGERSTDKPPQGKASRDDSNENRSVDSYRSDSRSPPYDDRYSERLGTVGRNGDRNIRYIYGERSPGHDHSDNKRSPRRFEVVDDRVRDLRHGTGNQIRKFEDRKLPDLGAKPDGLSPSRQKDRSSSPVVRPVRDILGDDAPQLRVGDAPKPNNTGAPDNSTPTQRTASLSSTGSNMGSNDENSVQSKKVNFESLIDFTADPEPPVAAAPQQPIPQEKTSPPSNGGDWASFDNNASQPKAVQTVGNAGTLESALAQLSTSASTVHMSTLPTSAVHASPKANDGRQWYAVQQHQTSLYPANTNHPTNPSFSAPIAVGQSWGSSATPSMQGHLPDSVVHSLQVANQPLQVTSVGGSSLTSSAEPKPTGRKELPLDLFTALYPSAPMSGWQRGPLPSFGYGMQYPIGMHQHQHQPQPQAMPPYLQQPKSMNPFDFGGEPALAHSPTFPSMGNLQGTLPHVPGPTPLARSSSLGSPSPQWVPPQQLSFPQAMPQGQYMVHQVPGNMPQPLHNNMFMMGHQGTGSPGSPAAMLRNLGMDQPPTARYSLPNTPSSFGSAGGNPFG